MGSVLACGILGSETSECTGVYKNPISATRNGLLRATSPKLQLCQSKSPKASTKHLLANSSPCI